MLVPPAAGIPTERGLTWIQGGKVVTGIGQLGRGRGTCPGGDCPQRRRGPPVVSQSAGERYDASEGRDRSNTGPHLIETTEPGIPK